MMDFLRRHRYYIFLFTMVVFLSGTFIGFGGYLFDGRSGDAVAEVNGEKIPLRIYQSHYRRKQDALGPGRTLDKAQSQQLRDETIRELVQAHVFAEQAKRYGIEVPDLQVVNSLTQIPAFLEKDGRFNPQLYLQALQSTLRLTPKDFEEEQRANIAFFKLRWVIQSVIKVTDHELALIAPAAAAGKPLKTDKDKEDLRGRIWQDKVLYSFNQWFNRMGNTLKVKTHFEVLEGTR
jgi:hypothetical protein